MFNIIAAAKAYGAETGAEIGAGSRAYSDTAQARHRLKLYSSGSAALFPVREGYYSKMLYRNFPAM
jgi:hypothetical protein